MRILLILLFSITAITSCKAQKAPSKNDIVHHFGFIQDSIIVETENIVYYSYSRSEEKIENLIIYLQGSDPSPQFSYRLSGTKIEKLCWLHGEFKEIPKNHLFVVIEKVGFENTIDENNIPKPQIYQQKNSLDNRVFRANAVINKLNSDYMFNKIIVYGHSEGAPVGAKLATINSEITHLGFWAGNALPDFYDFALDSRKEYYKGNISVAESQKQIDELIDSFKNDIATNPTNTEDDGYTKKRWWSYAEPPINNLLKLEIPIFVQVATNDESAPIESTYLIPLEFARLGKSNLTYKVCVGCDHGFNSKDNDGVIQRNWIDIFKEFISWTNENDH